MLPFSRIAVALLVVLTLASCSSPRTDSVDHARAINHERYESSEERRAAADFLVRMADARMMDSSESQEAQLRASSEDVRAYAALMIREQAMLLSEIRALAADKEIELPERISNAKAEGLQELRSKRGEAFDDKFVSMIIIDHERDVEAFRDATELSDPEVRDFARHRLPMIEDHLSKAQELASVR